MTEDQNFVEHGCELEKVLGYKYSTQNDTVQISNTQIDPKVNSKRGVLSQVAKVFDPISLAILRKIWSEARKC